MIFGKDSARSRIFLALILIIPGAFFIVHYRDVLFAKPAIKKSVGRPATVIVPDDIQKEVSSLGKFISDPKNSFCVGDFYDDKSQSFAALVSRSDNGVEKRQLIVFKKVGTNVVPTVLVDSLPDNISSQTPLFIDLVPKHYVAYDKEGKKKEFENDAIQLSNEKDDWPIYYWNMTGFDVFWESQRDR